MQEQIHETLAAEIGRRARKIRQMRGLTQKALAGHLAGRVDYSYIGKIERGEQLPSLKVLQRIAGALNVSLSYFFSDEAWTDLLPEEIRQVRRQSTHSILFRETMSLHPEDVPLVREILSVLARHRQQLRARTSLPSPPGRRRVSPGAFPMVAEDQAAYRPRRNRAAPREAVQGIGRAIRSLRRAGSEDLDEFCRRLEEILAGLTFQERKKRKPRARAVG
jgi:transcriptional regulator with XRE-family HTH domain